MTKQKYKTTITNCMNGSKLTIPEPFSPDLIEVDLKSCFILNVLLLMGFGASTYGSIQSYFIQGLFPILFYNLSELGNGEGADLKSTYGSLLEVKTFKDNSTKKGTLNAKCDVAPSSMTGVGRSYDKNKHQQWLTKFDYFIICNKSRLVIDKKLQFVILPSEYVNNNNLNKYITTDLLIKLGFYS